MRLQHPITRSRLQRLLLLGLCLFALLLLSALLVAFRSVRQLNRVTADFSLQQSHARSAIDEIVRQQADLNSRWLRLARRRDLVRREEILDQLEQNRKLMSSTLQSAYEQAELLRQSVSQTGHGLLRWTIWLLAICVGLALLCAGWLVRASTGLFKRLELQTAELTRLQYAFLETQEKTARRFSHELHDELGQSLTAIKANLSALRESREPARVEDSMTLVDQAIHDVREMSQLLRPTILDDFGLDAALRGLTDRFSQRTGVALDYRSDMKRLRLREEAETHLFRIAQEALTNVARHSGAKQVSVELRAEGGTVHLAIRDDGKGVNLSDRRTDGRPSEGLGLAGMQTRARGCGGELTVTSHTGRGFSVNVSCPIQ